MIELNGQVEEESPKLKLKFKMPFKKKKIKKPKNLKIFGAPLEEVADKTTGIPAFLQSAIVTATSHLAYSWTGIINKSVCICRRHISPFRELTSY